MKWIVFSVIVIISSGHFQSCFGQQIQEEEESSSKQLTNPTSVINEETEAESTPARQGPQNPGWGGLISGKKRIQYQLVCSFLSKHHLVPLESVP